MTEPDDVGCPVVDWLEIIVLIEILSIDVVDWVDTVIGTGGPPRFA